MMTVLLALAALLQDPPAPSRCDLVRIEEGRYCAKCDRVLRKTEKESDFDKDGNCKNCSGAPEKADVCVKDWVPTCGMHDQRSHERSCCPSKFCCKVEQVLALVVLRCPKCKKDGRAGPACACGVKPERTCRRSGTAPHGADCDLKTVESGPWCADRGCRKVLEKGDTDKEGRCLTCKKKPETVKICVKKDGDKTFRARVATSCRLCRSEGDEGSACATKDCPRAGKPREPVCTDSGCWPHGGKAPEKEK